MRGNFCFLLKTIFITAYCVVANNVTSWESARVKVRKSNGLNA